MNKEAVLELLHEKDPVEIVFLKVNGDVRVMKATLHEDNLPQVDETEPKKEKKKNPDVQPVYDVEAEGFRSFRWDSLVSVNGKMSGSYKLVQENDYRDMVEDVDFLQKLHSAGVDNWEGYEYAQNL